MAEPGSISEEVVQFTSDLIRFDTSNYGSGNCTERPAAEYVAETLGAAGIEAQILESAPGRANVVARVPGTHRDRDGLLVHGHLDVVPAQASDWQVHPFSGEVREGMVWGRGAIDMKGMVAMMLTVARAWARQGRRPRRDVVFAFTADEEDSAAAGSDWLVRAHPNLFEGCTEGISESGGYTFHTTDGTRIYPVGAGERGTAWLDLSASGTAGHGSRTTTDNAVGALAAAVARIDAHHWPVHLTPTVRAGLEALAGALGIPAAAQELTGQPGLARLGAARALVEHTLRNSTNPTMLSAGDKVNVIPAAASARVDGRVLPGTEEEFERVLDELTGPAVQWSYHHRSPALSAPVDGPMFGAISAALRAHDPQAQVVPVCLSGGTDAKQFSQLGITGYGFAPLRLPPDLHYQSLFHGVDERVPVDGLTFGAQVLDHFLSTVD
ncbi:MAG TPA: M20/M25/M40 family metallo-hydrolase [Beutenbergiaceae bacterium]|nr:M20/M25/M40 family metallo-hydrolase [Beutenbergiaceae bacterium]